MSFVELGGDLYPISSIERLKPKGEYHDGKPRPAKVYLKDGDEFGIAIWDHRIDQIVRAMWPVIPAAPGFRLLHFAYIPEASDDSGPWVYDEPILGWRVTDYGNQPLVTDADFTEMKERHAILEPTGKVYNWETGFKDQDEWMAEMKREADQKYANKLAEEQADG